MLNRLTRRVAPLLVSTTFVFGLSFFSQLPGCNPNEQAEEQLEVIVADLDGFAHEVH